MNKYRSAALALAAAAASLTVAACSAGTPTASSAASSPAASSSSALPVSSSAPPTTGPPIPGRMLTIQGALGSFPVPAAAKVGENISGGPSAIVVFGLITPADVARFYATALPQAGYTVTTNSMVSRGPQNGAVIVFNGHGYKGNIESVNQESGPAIAGIGQNVTTIVISPSS
jgi:hypothetical protein